MSHLQKHHQNNDLSKGRNQSHHDFPQLECTKSCYIQELYNIHIRACLYLACLVNSSHINVWSIWVKASLSWHTLLWGGGEQRLSRQARYYPLWSYIDMRAIDKLLIITPWDETPSLERHMADKLINGSKRRTLKTVPLFQDEIIRRGTYIDQVICSIITSPCEPSTKL